MSIMIVGLSHRTAPISLLERTTLTAEAASGLVAGLCRGDHVAEAIALVTCNRLEVYADVSKFHGGIGEIGAGLAEATGVPLAELTEHLYVHYENAAVAHLFQVTCGLDSMAVGEQQILGQVRVALRAAQAAGSAGRTIGHLVQNALRVGKRVHSETTLDRAAPSLVDAGLRKAAEVLGPLPGLNVLVLGAGAMSGLSVASAHRAQAGSIAVCSRTLPRARRLAESVDGTPVPLENLQNALAAADLVIACAGAGGYLVDLDAAGRAAAARGGRPQVYVDLALPRDVQPEIAGLPSTRVFDLEHLGQILTAGGLSEDLAEARSMVEDEVALYLADQRAKEVAPTVVALRAMARSVMEAELGRLSGRLDGLDPDVFAELEQTVHRVVEKLLHQPTVRVKELAAAPGGDTYAEALRLLFNLGPAPEPKAGELPGVELAVQLEQDSMSDLSALLGRTGGAS
ncbi:glutamyl-tRNA reductase [Kineosporia sp. J2-2]|uniref:Glutamyl-tRNA reductase n=1 Tax=Kineosporia corallincola TaxID=2835133 RepID=A0ABS5TC95_9ACTN|nr:glutamyl-tRNA reductase [Kineosporia corallincola]MBT0767743.1 glutamyl-tRNA reductase [Kineosporia corallincola]